MIDLPAERLTVFSAYVAELERIDATDALHEAEDREVKFVVHGQHFVHKEYDDFIEKLKSSSDTDALLSRAVRIVTRQYGVYVPSDYVFEDCDSDQAYLEKSRWLRKIGFDAYERDLIEWSQRKAPGIRYRRWLVGRLKCYASTTFTSEEEQYQRTGKFYRNIWDGVNRMPEDDVNFLAEIADYYNPFDY